MPRPEKHVFICGQSRPENHPRGSCGASGAASVAQQLADTVAKKQLFGKVAVTQTTCLGPCHMGANILVYPEGILYSQVKPENVESIVDQHLIGNQPVSELMAPSEVW